MGKLRSCNFVENESAFIENLLTPISRNPLEMMYMLQNADLGTCEHFENVALKQPVLTLDTYISIE